MPDNDDQNFGVNVTLLQKDLLYLCIALRQFPTTGDAGDRFADGDNPNRERRTVFNEVKLQTKRLLKTLEGVEDADCEPVEPDILIDLRARLFTIDLLWSNGPLPPLDRATLPALWGSLQTIERSCVNPGGDDV